MTEASAPGHTACMEILRSVRPGRLLAVFGAVIGLNACGEIAVTGSDALVRGEATAVDDAPPADALPPPSDAVADADAAPADTPIADAAVADAAPRTPGPWVAMRSDTTGALWAVWGSDRRTVWAVGEGGTNGGPSAVMVRWDGSAWAREPVPSELTRRGEFHDVWGSGPNDVWVVGGYVISTEGMTLHWDGLTWTRQSNAGERYDSGGVGVWGSGARDVWVAGGYGLVHRWDGAAWQSVHTARAGAGDPFAVFFRGAITDVWGHEGTTWFVGEATQEAGTIVRRAPDGTVTASVAGPGNLHSVWGSGANDVWAVGEAGAIVHWDGTRWAPFASGTTQRLNSVWGSGPTNVWAVGEMGTILRWRGRAWEAVTSPTTRTLRGVWGTGADDVWAVGNEGTILHWAE